jgi:hypothetical protein
MEKTKDNIINIVKLLSTSTYQNIDSNVIYNIDELSILHLAISTLLVIDYSNINLSKSMLNKFMLTLCIFLGKCTYILTDSLTQTIIKSNSSSNNMLYICNNIYNLFQSYYKITLKFLIDCIMSYNTVMEECICSIYKLVTHGYQCLIVIGNGEVNDNNTIEIIEYIVNQINIIITQYINTCVVISDNILVLVKSIMLLISNQNIQYSTHIIQYLTNPVLYYMNININNNNNNIISLIKLSTYIIKYSDSNDNNNNTLNNNNNNDEYIEGYIVPFISNLWAHIVSILEMCSNVNYPKSNIHTDIFLLIQECISHAPSLLLQYTTIQNIIQYCLHIFINKQIVESLNTIIYLHNICSNNKYSKYITYDYTNILEQIILDFINNIIITVFISKININLINCYNLRDVIYNHNNIDMMQFQQYINVWITNPDAIEISFQFIHYYIINKTLIIQKLIYNNNLNLISILLQYSIISLNLIADRDTIKTIIKTTCDFLTIFNSNNTNTDGANNREFSIQCLEYFEVYMYSVFINIDGVYESSIWASLSDLIYTFITMNIHIYNAEQTRLRLFNIIMSNHILPKITIDNKEILVNAIVYLTMNNTRRLKAIINDVGKICASEIESTVLQDYLVMNL